MLEDDDNELKVKKVKTVNVLLDIDDFYGRSQGRSMPWIIVITVACLPAIPLVVYPPIILIKPLLVFYLLLWACITVKTYLVVILEEPKRIEQFRRHLHSVYSSIISLLGIQVIHDDGCIEYKNGQIAYMLVVDTGEEKDVMVKAREVHAFLEGIIDNFIPDILVQNIRLVDGLKSRYSSIKLYGDKDVIKAIITLIKSAVHVADVDSYLCRIVFVMKGRRDDYNDIKNLLENTVLAKGAKAYKNMKIADKQLVRDIIEKDIDTYVDIEEILREKFKSNKYKGSKVINYIKKGA